MNDGPGGVGEHAYALTIHCLFGLAALISVCDQRAIGRQITSWVQNSGSFRWWHRLRSGTGFCGGGRGGAGTQRKQGEFPTVDQYEAVLYFAFIDLCSF
jgi:hypothetical protein